MLSKAMMLRYTANLLVAGLFFLGFLHSFEVILPARAIDGEYLTVCLLWVVSANDRLFGDIQFVLHFTYSFYVGL